MYSVVREFTCERALRCLQNKTRVPYGGEKEEA